jgi:hypothetical protein
MTTRAARILSIVGATLGTVAAGTAHAQAPVPGDEMRVTSKMEMAGMAMPARTYNVCMPRNRPADSGPADQPENCQLLEASSSGNTTRFRLRCTGEMEGEMTGETTTTATGYRQRMTMAADGQTMVMTQDAEKTGKECDAAEMERKMNAMMAKAEADSAKMMKEICAGSAKEVSQVPTFFGADATCKDPADVKTLCGNVRTPKGYYRLYDAKTAKLFGNEPAGVKALESACALKGPAPLKEELCGQAEGKRWWNFLAKECPVQAQALAAKECAGRDFTALQGSPYAGFCGAMGTGTPAAGDAEGDALADGSAPPAPAAPAGNEAQNAAQKAADKAKRGFKSLRDKVGF